MTWFRKEAGVHWIEIPGEHPAACEAVEDLLAAGIRNGTGHAFS